MNEVKSLLMRSREEIVSLRSQNQILAAKAEVVEVFAAALGLRRGEGGATVDVVWEIERAIKRMPDPQVETAPDLAEEQEV